MAPSALTSGKRKLVASYGISIALVMPFVLWGTIVLITGIVSYQSLTNMSGAIATMNTVNFVLIAHHRVFYYTLVRVHYYLYPRTCTCPSNRCAAGRAMTLFL